MSTPACLLSFVVPVYNVAPFLGACLASLLQPDLAIEVIAVDDGSTDNSIALLAGAAASDPRLKVVTQANAGVSAARNAGLRVARGVWVWFVDADDEISPDAIRHLLPLLGGNQSVVAFNALRGGAVAAAPIYRKPKPRAASGEVWVRTLCAQGEWRHLVWLYVVRREFLFQHQLFFAEKMVHEDIAWVTEVLVRAPALCYLDEALYHYRVHDQSLTGTATDRARARRVESYFTVIAQLQSINQRCPMEATTRKALQAEVVGQAVEMQRLIASIHEPGERAAWRSECLKRGLWRGLWADAVNWKRKRQVIAARLSEAFRGRFLYG